MFNNLKIHVALVISLAFVIRLLFVNISLVSWLGASHSAATFKTMSAVKKRDHHVEVVPMSDVRDYNIVEVCEEGSDKEEDLVKVSFPFTLCFFNSLFKNLSYSTASNQEFAYTRCELCPKKYLALSVLRI